ncbi:MAG: molybdenum cofactor biosynthesis protein B [Gemmatimonadetes bacterium]|jgi:molybdenum cofactor biosynthesis protein B|nr:molybdenum cofactor biosynthesis protein B [Gemmatimonadota bacterium]MBT5328335.1 molybdenum cofactor biosynthesis protein B [Gemmatimonadota bacterium]MBT5450168.1 molybdenum cofactor biosynthesis protein B [Gemmatimonadota bacterium]MBT5802321.1 molybdenum cofactor biosynthesis protein B [Gemmatimonadota bacterium]MBT6619950.1 molybdenum cofactor biosynthesis protein B [Gemmatimonadota bacterium]
MSEARVPVNIAILTVSDTRDESTDKSGKLLVERLTEAGHNLHEKCIRPDDIYQLRAQVSQWIADDKVQAVVTTGGTGLTGRDGTPEALSVLFDKQIEGFGEVFRMLSYEEIGASTLQSRCIAGVANGTYIFSLPGSSGACATGWDKLIGPQLDSTNQPCNLVDLMPRLLET